MITNPILTVEPLDQWFYIKTQLARVHIRVSGDTWELKGVFPEEPKPEDEVIWCQLQWLWTLKQYGIYKVDFIDWMMAVPELVFGWVLNKTRSMLGAKREWSQTGKLVKSS